MRDDGRRGVCPDHHQDGWGLLDQRNDKMPQATLHPVAGDGVAHGLGHNKAHPGRGALVVPLVRRGWQPSCMHDKRGAGRPSATSRDVLELGRRGHPILDGQHPNSSGGQLGAALATTGGQDGATGAGAHAGAEAVGTATATVARLEGALAHGDYSLTTRRWTAAPTADRMARGSASPTAGDWATIRARGPLGQTRAMYSRSHLSNYIRVVQSTRRTADNSFVRPLARACRAG